MHGIMTFFYLLVLMEKCIKCARWGLSCNACLSEDWGLNNIPSKKRGRIHKGHKGSILLLWSACMVMASSSWWQPQCETSHLPWGRLLMSPSTSFFFLLLKPDLKHTEGESDLWNSKVEEQGAMLRWTDASINVCLVRGEMPSWDVPSLWLIVLKPFLLWSPFSDTAE